jgi:predicted nucleic acid-binding protein
LIFVDSSVWIDFYNDIDTAAATRLEAAIRSKEVIVGDLVLTELLQGFRSDAIARKVHAELQAFETVTVLNPDIAILAAHHYRLLRVKGITVRKTIDTLIATRCIAEGWSLLHRDPDYEPFVTHLGLRPAIRAH